jgi:hypothetical protein
LFVSYAEAYTAPNLKKRNSNLVLHHSAQLIPLHLIGLFLASFGVGRAYSYTHSLFIPLLYVVGIG